MGRPRLIVLVRHGESEGNCDKSVNCVTANHRIPLTAQGHQQAHNAGVELMTHLRADDKVLFYTSPYMRARETTDEILSVMKDNNVEHKVYEESRLREQDFGNFQGGPGEMNKIWAERAHYGHFFYRIPNGESAADVYDRCAGFNETLFRQFNSERFPSVLVLVTHGIWARVFLMKWFRWTYERFESLRNIRHCELLIMERLETTHKYSLKTKLRTWDDADDNDDKTENGLNPDDSSTLEKEILIREKFLAAQQ